MAPREFQCYKSSSYFGVATLADCLTVDSLQFRPPNFQMTPKTFFFLALLNAEETQLQGTSCHLKKENEVEMRPIVKFVLFLI